MINEFFWDDDFNRDIELEKLNILLLIPILIIFSVWFLYRKIKRFLFLRKDKGILTKHILRKAEFEIVLRGMRHVAPRELYLNIQSELDAANNTGYTIFIEGVKKPTAKEIKSASDNEHRIMRFFNLLTSLYPFFAKIGNEKTQKDMIKYPKTSIHADTTMIEVARRLNIIGFKPKFTLKLLELVHSSINKDSALIKELETSMEDNFEKYGKKRRKTKFTDGILFFLFFGKMLDVVLFWRNEIAVTKLLNHFNKKNITKAYMHYGQAHVPGIIELLKKDGWEEKLIEKTPIYPGQ